MSAETVRLLWERMEARDWDAAGAQLHEDVVVDWPHSGERIRSRESFVALQRTYPEGWNIDVLRVVDAGETVAADVRVDHGGTTFYCAGFYDVREGRISRGTEYWVTAGSAEPPDWRAKWTERL